MDSIGIKVRMAGMDKGNMKSSGYPLGIDHGEELALGMDYVRRPLVYLVEKRVEERHRGIRVLIELRKVAAEIIDATLELRRLPVVNREDANFMPLFFEAFPLVQDSRGHPTLKGKIELGGNKNLHQLSPDLSSLPGIAATGKKSFT